jgi:hypothetical protein
MVRGSAGYLLLTTIQANDVAFKGLVCELNRADNVETGLLERAGECRLLTDGSATIAPRSTLTKM